MLKRVELIIIEKLTLGRRIAKSRKQILKPSELN